MPIEMPKGLPFSVDTWTPSSSRKRHHFLTHAHRDHLQGLASNSSYPIYATRLTKILTRYHFPQIEEASFVEVEVGETVLIRDPDGDFSVMAFDANHCPGAVMFLFEGEFGNLLHTGDCRLSPDCLQMLPLKYITKKGSATCLDYLLLDCTFGRSSIALPTKELAIQQVINCIWKHPNAPVVYLACDLLGQEEILVEVSKAFGSKIYVDKTKCAECFQALLLIAPEILSEDTSSRFHVFEGFPRLYERASAKLAEARANIQPEPLFIRPSAQWYACDDRPETEHQSLSLSEANRDEFGVWHVCYSMHSSRQELEWALQLLRPKWVISTTPPCRAMDLEYVRDNCYKTKLTSNELILKLFCVGTAGKSAPSPVSDVTGNSSISIPIVEEGQEASTSYGECNQLQMQKRYLLWDIPPPTKERPLTLFGRARLGPQDPSTSNDAKIVTTTISSMETSLASSIEGGTTEGEIVHLREATVSEQTPSSREGSICDLHFGKTEAREVEVISELNSGKTEIREFEGRQDASYVGSSNVYNSSLRRLYRSMNVPVPRPLPSLVELMGPSKRPKIGF